jgi:hypothetical protein
MSRLGYSHILAEHTKTAHLHTRRRAEMKAGVTYYTAEHEPGSSVHT